MVLLGGVGKGLGQRAHLGFAVPLARLGGFEEQLGFAGLENTRIALHAAGVEDGLRAATSGNRFEVAEGVAEPVPMAAASLASSWPILGSSMGSHRVKHYLRRAGQLAVGGEHAAVRHLHHGLGRDDS